MTEFPGIASMPRFYCLAKPIRKWALPITTPRWVELFLPAPETWSTWEGALSPSSAEYLRVSTVLRNSSYFVILTPTEPREACNYQSFVRHRVRIDLRLQATSALIVHSTLSKYGLRATAHGDFVSLRADSRHTGAHSLSFDRPIPICR